MNALAALVDRNVSFDCSCLLSVLLKHSLALGNDVLICGGKNLLRLGGMLILFLFVEDENVLFHTTFEMSVHCVVAQCEWNGPSFWGCLSEPPVFRADSDEHGSPGEQLGSRLHV